MTADQLRVAYAIAARLAKSRSVKTILGLTFPEAAIVTLLIIEATPPIWKASKWAYKKWKHRRIHVKTSNAFRRNPQFF